MIRKIITIDSNKCNGCGLCVTACHEGAIQLKEGKAYLIREDYCDGLGDCLPSCPLDAISFETREALEFNSIAVQENIKKEQASISCPGSLSQSLQSGEVDAQINSISALKQWPVQLQLVPVEASCFNDCNLLLAADCAAYSYANFHNSFMKNATTVILCPKLDSADYVEKLAQILRKNSIRKLIVVKMEVPCCGLDYIAHKAVDLSGTHIPIVSHTLSLEGDIL